MRRRLRFAVATTTTTATAATTTALRFFSFGAAPTFRTLHPALFCGLSVPDGLDREIDCNGDHRDDEDEHDDLGEG